ncbi:MULTISPECIES: fasciclin domain-containing protein [Methanoculleus]|uniref:Beta-Ig-H3/fasciclin n=2 Tax=Methanoculleus TaxID=45989 RepID=A3CWA1_METMJ|nr:MULTISPECIES: fasciclin domain-containing protein [Methanoculleus]ABN57651.1 beta-Ig-H3/fasciclin [Methanoculleus marisnigri JR1]MCC7556006.1 fasciclin domain-containing protein [Methanoculleus marisnigri]UYU19047.1 fasciclin domain-containing protein [Methanoculleus submarinus]
MKSILATLRESGSFDVFLDLVRTAGMEERLSTEGPYTLFVPDDDAFHEISRPELEAIRRNADRLGDTLNYHIVPGVHSMIDLLGIRTLRSLQGGDLAVEVAPEGVLVNDVAVVEADAWCTNGICHAVSALLLPPVARAVAVHG